MRKILTAILSVLCLACLCLAAAACTGPKYYKLTYDAIAGVKLDFGEIKSGAKVRDGYTVKFTCTVDENRVTGDPTVLINGEDEYPDLEGVYSFEMSRDTEVTVSGVYTINTFDITFDKEDARIKYLDAKTGEELSTLEGLAVGTEVRFKLDISVYYDRASKYSVLANTTVIKPDAGGVYSFNVARKTTVKVSGLELEKSFIERKDSGNGTQSSPYLLKRPIDLYVMADLVNNPFYLGRYGMAYYKLTADIDMEGEQLFIIGDSTSSSAVFCGDFDGNGHKIYNYYIKDTIIEQSEFTTVFLPYIGLFGTAAATTAGPARIYDLTVEDFDISVNASKFNKTFAAGGIVGAGLGVSITNCKVNGGTIIADADDVYYGYIGGVVGFLQSVYNSEAQRAYSAVNGCSANVDIQGQSGYLYAAGGIAGYVMSMQKDTVAYIINSYSDGAVYGAMNAGGIAGYMSPYSSVKNSYARGIVDAYNAVTPSQGFEEHAYAYAGGIAGYVERDSVVSGCFSLADVHAAADGGSKYEKAGKICGGLSNGGGENIECGPALVVSCSDDPHAIGKDFVEALGWNVEEWTFDNGYPEYNKPVGNMTAQVTIKYMVNGSFTEGKLINLEAKDYRAVAEWYRNQLPEYISKTDGNRSYGYYFDTELTQKVPNGYVLTGNETLYCGFADYASVAGTYYLQTAESGSGANIELKADGSLIYRMGALNLTSYYIFDGETITLFDCPAFTETKTENNTTTTYYSCGKGTLADGKLTLLNNISYTEQSPLCAVKKLDGFIYGGYYSDNGKECVFNEDGTGMLAGSPITYTVSGNSVNIAGVGTGTVNTANRTVVIGSTVYKAYDPFKGTWEKSATTHVEFTFDGKGAWTYEYYGYVNGEKSVLTSDKGTYVFDGTDTLTLNGGSVIAGGTQVSMDENGFIKLTNTDLTYYKDMSLVGMWRFFYNEEAIEITFKGIGKDGYGVALVSYETVASDLEVTYHMQRVNGVDYVYLFLEDSVLGILHYDVNDFTLRGMIYSYKDNEMLDNYVVYSDEVDADGNRKVIATYEDIVSFCLYDDFGGQWIGEDWGLVEFNGYGLYKLKSILIREERNKVLTSAVSGSVKIGQKNGSYKLENATMKGTLVYDGATYTIEYNQATDTITVTGVTSFTLCRPDRLYGLQLKGEDGTVYVFDGGSGLAGGGNVTVGSASYKYTINGTTISVTGLGNITVSGDKFLLGGKTLSVVNNFTGEWHVGGTLKTLVIGEIGASFTAQGSYRGQSTVFTYNVKENHLSFNYNGRTYYAFAMLAQNKYELIVSNVDNVSEGNNIICIGTGEQLDKYRGTFTAANGKYIVFDGLGLSKYGSGTALQYSKDNVVEAAYSYKINSFGMALLTGAEDVRFIAADADASEAGAYIGSNGTAYKLVEPDKLYLREAAGADDLKGKTFVFDGIDTVVCGEEQYKYVINGRDELRLVYKLTLTDKNGKEIMAEVSYGSNLTFRFVDELTGIIIKDGKLTYTFVSIGTMKLVDGIGDDMVEKVYKYTITAHDKDAKKYTLTMSSDFENYIAEVDYSNEDEYKISMRIV